MFPDLGTGRSEVWEHSCHRNHPGVGWQRGFCAVFNQMLRSPINWPLSVRVTGFTKIEKNERLKNSLDWPYCSDIGQGDGWTRDFSASLLLMFRRLLGDFSRNKRVDSGRFGPRPPGQLRGYRQRGQCGQQGRRQRSTGRTKTSTAGPARKRNRFVRATRISCFSCYTSR